MSAIQTNPSSVSGVGAIQGLASGQDSQKSASNQVMARAIQELIEKFDTNKDRKLDASELKDMFSQLMKPGGDEKSSCCDAKGGGSSGGAGGKDNSMDINKDGKVDIQDLLAMLMGQGAQGGEGAKGGQGAQGGGGSNAAAGGPEAGGGAASGAPTGAQAAPGAGEAGMDENGQFDIKALVNMLVQMLSQMLQGGSGGQAAPGANAGGGGGGKENGGADINKDGKVDIQDLLAMLMGQGAQGAGGGGAAPSSGSSGGGGGNAGGVGGAGGADSAAAAGGAGQGADAGGGLNGQIDLEALLGALMQMLQQGGGAAQSGPAAGGSPQAGGEQAGGGDVNKDGKIDMQDLMALLSQLMGQSSDPAASGGGGSGSGGGSPAPSGSGGGGAPAAQGSGGGAPAAPSSGGGAPATQGGGGGGAGAAGGATQGAGNAPNGSKPAPSAGSGGIEGGPSATDGKPKVNKFETIEPGEGPAQTIGKDGKFVFNRVVDDSFLPKEVRAGMQDAVQKNMKDNDFFKDNFRNEKDAYQYLVQMANLESGRGATLKNSGDAQNTGTGGSSGYMHLHDKFGYEKEQGGRALNTEGWTPEEAQQDYSKYTTLVMRKLDAGYQQAGADNTQEAAEKTMSMWWVGNDSTEAGKYYLSALSNGSGVNHNTGSTFA